MTADPYSGSVAPKLSVKPPVPVIARSPNVATPATADCVTVPASVPPPGLIDALMAIVELAILRFAASRTSIFHGVITIPLVPIDGCCVTARPRGTWTAVIGPEVPTLPAASGSDPAVNVTVTGPVPATPRFVKVATPLTALTVVVPISCPVPLAIEAVTCAVEFETSTPVASLSNTTGCVVNGTPLSAPTGNVWTAYCVAGATHIVPVALYSCPISVATRARSYSCTSSMAPLKVYAPPPNDPTTRPPMRSVEAVFGV